MAEKYLKIKLIQLIIIWTPNIFSEKIISLLIYCQLMVGWDLIFFTLLVVGSQGGKMV